MAFPSTISSLIEPYHNVGGPFVSSLDAVYVITRTAGGGGVQIFKGIGPIDTWSGVASLNVTSGNTVRALDVYQVSDALHIVTRDAAAASSNQIRYHVFDMSTDTFTTSNQLVKTTYTQAGTVDESMIGIVVRSAGDKIVIYEGPQVLADIQRARTYYARHLGVGWSADIAMDNGGNADWFPQEIILGLANRVHFFLSNYTTNALYQRTLTSANALETFPAAFDSTLSHNVDVGFQRGVAYSASAGGTVVRYAYFDTAFPALADVQFTSTDAPSPLSVTTSITGAITPLANNIRYVVSLANDGNTVYGTFVNNNRSIAYDNGAVGGTVGNINSCGMLLTATAGATLLVFVNVGSGNGTVSAVNVGATQLTRLGGIDFRPAAAMRHEVWGLTSPASGTLTISAALKDGELTSFVIAGATYTGQRTTATPFGAVVTNSISASVSSSLTISATTAGTVAVFGFGFEEPGNASAGSGLTTRKVTTAAFPTIIIADAPGGTSVIGSASRSDTNFWGNLGLSIIASSSTAGVYMMSSQDAGSWSTPTLLQTATGIHIWSNCFVRNSARVLAVVFNDGGTIKYTEYSLSAGASASVFITHLGLMGIGR